MTALWIVGIVLGSLGIVTCWYFVLGLPFSAAGLVCSIFAIKGGNKKGKIGLGLSIAGLVLTILVMIIYFAFWGSLFALFGSAD